MRVAVVSDIHANLAALEAVLAHAEGAGRVDAVWNLGDCVGYGPQPCECIARLREADALWVAGNHERAATGAIDTGDFNPAAAEAAKWTARQLGQEERSLLDSLPEHVVEGRFVFVHGSLREPIWEYLVHAESARAHFALMTVPFGFVGHTHVPTVATEDPSSPDGCSFDRLRDGDAVQLGDGLKVVINPGSVGQPRDGDRRASYGIYDSGEMRFTLRRVEYEIEATQRLMEDARLPAWLSERLSIGR
jgi:predicted phosphodiesterase